jgi:hypothetical protein
LWPYGLWRNTVLYVVTSVSEGPLTSIIRVGDVMTQKTTVHISRTICRWPWHHVMDVKLHAFENFVLDGCECSTLQVLYPQYRLDRGQSSVVGRTGTQ